MNRFRILALAFVAVSATLLTSCEKDPEPQTKTTDYAFNTGQLGAGTAYSGSHPNTLTASVKLTESGSQTIVRVTLTNTINGEDYTVHVHDAQAGSPPYNQTPNANILATTIAGTGGTVSKDYTSTMTYNALTVDYAGGFFVVHDPTQPISTTDLTTYLVVGAFEQ
jgi:hypothetical protein